jgi:hypothetical protein
MIRPRRVRPLQLPFRRFGAPLYRYAYYKNKKRHRARKSNRIYFLYASTTAGRSGCEWLDLWASRGACVISFWGCGESNEITQRLLIHQGLQGGKRKKKGERFFFFSRHHQWYRVVLMLWLFIKTFEWIRPNDRSCLSILILKAKENPKIERESGSTVEAKCPDNRPEDDDDDDKELKIIEDQCGIVCDSPGPDFSL